MIQYHAAWVLPIASPPIREGWVAVEHGRIVAVGRRRGAREAFDASSSRRVSHEIDLRSAAILPGLVNAHTHLELSWLRGRVSKASSPVWWVRDLLARRAELKDAGHPTIIHAIFEAVDEARAAGTALVGDISNTLASVGPLAASQLGALVFKELIRFNPVDPVQLVQAAREELETLRATGNVRVSLAAHAPYSVGPLLFRALKAALDHEPFAPSTVHLGESREELDFLKHGTGPWRDLLDEVGTWDQAWKPPGCGPVEYLDRAGFLDARTVVAHGVHLTGAELKRLAALGATLVTCPRSNLYTGAGKPPVRAFYESGVRVAVGTDSLASAPDLNVFSELAELRRLAASVPATALLESATLNGARALGFEADYGTIEPGKKGDLIAVDIPTGNVDVEEYLLTGIRPNEVQWLNGASVLGA
jgi:cytosine/adenosine deaminase-related metal-dependent hydrolase